MTRLAGAPSNSDFHGESNVGWKMMPGMYCSHCKDYLGGEKGSYCSEECDQAASLSALCTLAEIINKLENAGREDEIPEARAEYEEGLENYKDEYL